MTDLFTFDGGRGQRAEGFRFHLLDRWNSFVAELPVDYEGARISNNINRKVKRSLTGLTLPPSVTADIDTLTERVQPFYVDAAGTMYPLGVFLFSDVTRDEALYGSAQFTTGPGPGAFTTGTLLDQLVGLDQPTRGVTFAAPGDLVYDLMVQQVEQGGGIVNYDIEATDVTVAEWTVWKPEVTRLQVINDLAAMAGFYSLYFDNSGAAVLRSVPSLGAVEPTLVYGSGNVDAGTIKVTDDLLDAPNVYLVVNAGMAGGGPVWGEWKVPNDAPHSEANRGRPIVKRFDVQGVSSNSQAASIAKARGQADFSTYRWLNFSAPIDPRHDTYDVVGWTDAERYREQSWNMPLIAGGSMTHELRRVWNDDLADLVVEEA